MNNLVHTCQTFCLENLREEISKYMPLSATPLSYPAVREYKEDILRSSFQPPHFYAEGC